MSGLKTDFMFIFLLLVLSFQYNEKLNHLNKFYLKLQLLRLQVENCSAYTTCDECIAVNGETDGDPYCGWCTLERRYA